MKKFRRQLDRAASEQSDVARHLCLATPQYDWSRVTPEELCRGNELCVKAASQTADGQPDWKTLSDDELMELQAIYRKAMGLMHRT
jgi:hypothetical protein